MSRPSHGGRRLGTAIETSAAWTIAPMWNVNGFVGHIAGGPVVTGSFASDRLWFVYFENSLRWRLGR